MAKRKTKISITIPPYETPRNAWRRKIIEEAKKANITYRHTDKLQLKVHLYFNKEALFSHDVDNRLKDIMDALQGRVGGPKKNRPLAPIIPNDHQIFRATIEKSLPPKQSKGYGHLYITKYISKDS
jgi:Holliday junction resolvase RusA-like endonuclease